MFAKIFYHNVVNRKSYTYYIAQDEEFGSIISFIFLLYEYFFSRNVSEYSFFPLAIQFFFYTDSVFILHLD